MTTTTFGIGYIIAVRTDIVNPTPDYLGIAQSMQIDLKQEIKTLFGQFRLPVDAAGGKLDVTGKVKFARWQGNIVNDLLFGQTLTTGSGKQVSVAVGGLPENHPASASVTVTNSATFTEDLGVFDHATGKQLTRVAATPAVGSYSVAAGVYTFNASQTGTLDFFYEYTVTTQNSITVVNTLMGALPSFEVHYQHYYVAQSGALNLFHVKLNACKGGDLSMPFKNDDFAMIDWSFTAFADQSGTLGTWDFSE